jgi:predicted aminopeptidase
MKRALPGAVPLRCWDRGQRAARRTLRYRWIGSLGGLGLCTLLLNGCGLGYLWHVTVGQAKLLAYQQPVEEVLQDSRLSVQEQQKLRLILDVRAFAIEHLGLRASDSYTTFVWVDGPYISYNLSAAPKDALQPYIWWFPIVGRLPYKGFFNKAAALREERALAEQGYDTYVGGVRAFSTLGYFRDAILSCMLSYDDFSLISTIIHELLHQTVWVKGSVSFNESLANFIGDKGTTAYLTWRDGVAAAEVQRYQDIRADAGIFEVYMQALIERLEALYRQPISREEKIHQREQIFAQAIDAYPAVFPYMKTAHYQRFFEQRTLNNAVLLSFRLYYRDSAFFERALLAHGGDLRQMIAFFKTLRPDQIPTAFRTP